MDVLPQSFFQFFPLFTLDEFLLKANGQCTRIGNSNPNTRKPQNENSHSVSLADAKNINYWKYIGVVLKTPIIKFYKTECRPGFEQ